MAMALHPNWCESRRICQPQSSSEGDGELNRVVIRDARRLYPLRMDSLPTLYQPARRSNKHSGLRIQGDREQNQTDREGIIWHLSSLTVIVSSTMPVCSASVAGEMHNMRE